jgi:hypothetical protein
MNKILIIVLLAATLLAQERGRVTILNNEVVTAEGNELRGEAKLVMLWDGWYQEVTDVANWIKLRDTYNLNTVRLVMYQEPINITGYTCDPTNQCFNVAQATSILDAAVATAKDVGMYVIIDYHPVGGVDTSACRQWWDVVAPRYKDDTNVMYEIANEPVAWSPGDYTAADVDFQEYMYTRVRSQAPNTHLILWSFSNSSSNMKTVVDQGPTISYANASVAFHYYSASSAAITQLKGTYPVIMTEYQPDWEGGAAGPNLTTCVNDLESKNIGWIFLKTVYPTDHMTSRVTWAKDPFFTGGGTPTTWDQIWYETFDDTVVNYPLLLYDMQNGTGYDLDGYEWSQTQDMTGGGYSYKGDHADDGYSPVIFLENTDQWFVDGTYIRMYRYHDSNYWDYDQLVSNSKCGPSATPYDWNYKWFLCTDNVAQSGVMSQTINYVLANNTGAGPTFWIPGNLCSTQDVWSYDSYASANFQKGVWQKVEYYIKVGDNASYDNPMVFIIQVDDVEMLRVDVASACIRASNLDGSHMPQIVSLNVSNATSCQKPDAGYGTHYIDQITIAVGADSTIVDNEPPETVCPTCDVTPVTWIQTMSLTNPTITVTSISSDLDSMNVTLNDVLLETAKATGGFTYDHQSSMIEGWNEYLVEAWDDSSNYSSQTSRMLKQTTSSSLGRAAVLDTIIAY